MRSPVRVRTSSAGPVLVIGRVLVLVVADRSGLLIRWRSVPRG